MSCVISPIKAIVYAPCTAVDWVCSKVRKIAEAIFGFILRITTFQLGEIKSTSARLFMRFYQRAIACDPREERPYDPERLAISKQFLLDCGGVASIVDPEDNGAQVRCMTFRSADFFEALERQGAETITVTYQGQNRQALLNLPVDIAKKLYYPLINTRMLDGQIRKVALLPERRAGNGPAPMILHSHSPGRSMCMDRRFIGLHLAAGYDIAIWDPRGSAESTGTPTEAGYYLDAEAVYQHVLAQNYQPNRIYVSGFCEGGSMAAYLKRRHHQEGVHFIGSNLYTSMKDVVNGYGCIGRLATRYGLDAIKDPESQIEQDGFDNVNKFTNLAPSQSRFVFVYTDTDKLVPPKSVDTLIRTVGVAGECIRIHRKHPDKKADGHMQPPIEDPAVWHEYVQHVI